MMDQIEQKWSQVAKEYARIKEVFDHVAIGDDLQMMAPLLELMTIISSAKTLKAGLSSLFLAQYFAGIGIEAEESASGFVGVHMSRLGNRISEALLSEVIFSPKPKVENELFIRIMVKSTLLLSTAGAIFLSRKKEGKEKEEVSLISAKLKLILMARTRILQRTFKELILPYGANEKSTEIIAEILSLVAILNVLLILEHRLRNIDTIFQALNRHLKKSFDHLKGWLDERVTDNKKMEEVKAFLTQVFSSLESGSHEDFFEAIKKLLDNNGITKNGLDLDVAEIEATFDTLATHIKTGMTETSKSVLGLTIVV